MDHVFRGQVAGDHNHDIIRIEVSGLVGKLRSPLGIFGVESGGGHDGTAQVFRRNDECLRRRYGGLYVFGSRRCDETIAPAYHGLQVLWFIGIVRESAADLADRGINSLLYVDEDILAPQVGGDLVTGDELAAIFDQEHEQLQGKALESNGAASAVKAESAVIKLEVVEANFLIGQRTTPKTFSGSIEVVVNRRIGRHRFTKLLRARNSGLLG